MNATRMRNLLRLSSLKDVMGGGRRAPSASTGPAWGAAHYAIYRRNGSPADGKSRHPCHDSANAMGGGRIGNPVRMSYVVAQESPAGRRQRRNLRRRVFVVAGVVFAQGRVRAGRAGG